MKNLVTILAVVTALTTMIHAGPVLAAAGDRGKPPERGTPEYENYLEIGGVPAMDGQMNDPATEPKPDEKAPNNRAGVDIDRIGIDTL